MTRARRSRESLYKALSGEQIPDILKVMNALWLKLHAEVSHG
jgi:DNA-binding phage protein